MTEEIQDDDVAMICKNCNTELCVETHQSIAFINEYKLMTASNEIALGPKRKQSGLEDSDPPIVFCNIGCLKEWVNK